MANENWNQMTYDEKINMLRDDIIHLSDKHNQLAEEVRRLSLQVEGLTRTHQKT